MNSKLVSVIIPNFNRETTISETLNSVLYQSYQNWEVIIIDDGSTDGSISVIQSFIDKDDRFSYFLRGRISKGPSTCRNIGVEKAKGEYLIFLDSDDLLADFCLKQRVEFMQEHPELDFTIFNLELFNKIPGDLTVMFNKYPKNTDSYLKMFLRNNLPWACPNPIWKKESFVKLGGFNEEIVIMEDPELHTRALLNNLKYEVVKNSRPDCFYRQNSFNKEKKEYFYEMSIKGRIFYIRQMFSIIKEKKLSKNENNQLLSSLRKAYILLIKNFFIARIDRHKELFFDTLNWTLKNRVISFVDFILIKTLAKCWLSESIFTKYLRLKGLIFYFIR